MKSTLLLNVALVFLLSTSVAIADTIPAFPVGAYSLPDGEILVISDFGGSLRFFTQGGRTGSLKKTGKHTYEGSERHLHKDDSHHILSQSNTGIRFQGAMGDLSLKPIALKSNDYYFPSGNNRLRGRLLTPADGQFQGIVIPVHGSENFSAVDHYHLPYLFAANELAVFVYDKRGTGKSDGKQVSIQRGVKDLTELALDTAAAANFVAAQPSLASHPIKYKVYPETEHGLVQFKTLSPQDRQAVSCHPEYFDDMIGWLKEVAKKHAPASPENPVTFLPVTTQLRHTPPAS